MRFGQLVMGPAGSGKTTYCDAMVKHGATLGRAIRVVNLDPASEDTSVQYYADIRQMIQVDDVMEDKEMKLGPNGGLIYCMEYLSSNLEWLKDELDDTDNDYILFDCPGQIELYTHVAVLKKLSELLQNEMNFRLCGIFLLDAQFMLSSSKFISGVLVALSCMVNLEIPFVNILTKMDLVSKQNKQLLETFMDPDSESVISIDDSELKTPFDQKYRKLTEGLGKLMDDYSLVRFGTLDLTDEDSISDTLLAVDTSLQYAEDQEVHDRYPEEANEDDTED